MIPLAQFEKFLASSVSQARGRASVTLGIFMKAVAVEAKGMIGHELAIWPPLAPSTIAQKKKLGYVGRISATDPLLRTGEMRDSIDGEAFGLTGIVGATDEKAVYHELGTAKMPPRRFLGPALVGQLPVAERFFGELAMSLLTPPQSMTRRSVDGE